MYAKDGDSLSSDTKYRISSRCFHKTGSTHTCTATGKMHKIGEIRPRGFRVMRADRQTDRHTDKQTQTYSSQYFATLPGGSNTWRDAKLTRYCAFTLATCCRTSSATSCRICGQCERTRTQVAELVAQLVSSVNGSSNILGHNAAGRRAIAQCLCAKRYYRVPVCGMKMSPTLSRTRGLNRPI